jgi:outer membrane protein assembly factor BamB
LDAGHASWLYFQSEHGNGVGLKAGTKFEKLSENNLGERTLASYGVHGDALLIRGEKHLFCIGSGKQ